MLGKIENITIEDEQQKYIPNCGIIFLNTFPRLIFESYKLLQNNQFQSKKCEIKAVQILYFLSTSRDFFEKESEIYIFKIILKIPEDECIQFSKPLTNEEKNDCNQLLQNFIDSWGILKESSISILQTEFIQRKGLVAVDEKTISINLENSMVDILLQNFPYNYNILKLPWLEKLIITTI